MVESNFERDQKLNQQPELSNGLTREGISIDTMYECLQGKKQSDGSLNKLKLRIIVRGDLNNKKMIGDTWDPTVSTRNLKYFLEDSEKYK